MAVFDTSVAVNVPAIRPEEGDLHDASLKQGGTAIVSVSFTNEAGAAVIPTAATWSLRDGNGSIVNSRNQIAISPLAATVEITLSGNDLSLSDALDGVRVLTIEGTYVGVGGSTLPIKAEYILRVKNLLGVG